MITPWVLCDCCEDYLCNIHSGEHVHDCDCPEITVWMMNECYPYGPCTHADIRAVLAHPVEDDEYD